MAVAMLYFVIFSLVGMGTLILAGFSRSNSENQVTSKKIDYEMESILNIAQWRMNHGNDSLANYSENNISVTFNNSTNILSAMSTVDTTKKISITLKHDFPFNHGVAYLTETDTSKNSIATLPNHGIKQFNVWPDLDIDYYRNNAVKIYTSVEKFDSIMEPGIHFVESGTVRLNNGTSLNGTLVILGKLKIVGSNITLSAQMQPDSTYLPALIVADSTADVSTSPAINIYGAVFSSGPLSIKGGNLTGPLVATTMRLSANLNINDQANDKYYHWPHGFGNIDNYDWDKEIVNGSWNN